MKPWEEQSPPHPEPTPAVTAQPKCLGGVRREEHTGLKQFAEDGHKGLRRLEGVERKQREGWEGREWGWRQVRAPSMRKGSPKPDTS